MTEPGDSPELSGEKNSEAGERGEMMAKVTAGEEAGEVIREAGKVVGKLGEICVLTGELGELNKTDKVTGEVGEVRDWWVKWNRSCGEVGENGTVDMEACGAEKSSESEGCVSDSRDPSHTQPDATQEIPLHPAEKFIAFLQLT